MVAILYTDKLSDIFCEEKSVIKGNAMIIVGRPMGAPTMLCHCKYNEESFGKSVLRFFTAFRMTIKGFRQYIIGTK